jgi:hypothetical protein
MSLQSVTRMSKGPNRFAREGERLAVATTARVVAASNKVFISHLTGIDARTSSSRLDLALCPCLDSKALTFPRCDMGIGAGYGKCPLAIIAMSPLHRRRVRRAYSGSAVRSRRRGGSETRSRSLSRSLAGRRPSPGSPRQAIPVTARRRADPADGLSGLDRITVAGELSTRATISHWNDFQPGFWRKCLTGPGVNDGFGSL